MSAAMPEKAAIEQPQGETAKGEEEEVSLTSSSHSQDQ
jgi:hypothetical protein